MSAMKTYQIELSESLSTLDDTQQHISDISELLVIDSRESLMAVAVCLEIQTKLKELYDLVESQRGC